MPESFNHGTSGQRSGRRRLISQGTGTLVHLARILLLAAMTGTLGACSSTYTVQPPPASTLAEPAPVAVLDHGRHSSLVVGLPDGRMVRYAYGDWRWYALGDTGLVQGLAALSGDTPAALGRRVLPGPLTAETLRRQVRAGFAEAAMLEVEGAAARALVARLDAIAEAGRERMIVNMAVDLDFFPHPMPYSMAHNSNRVVAQWLRDMGAEVAGDGVLADWRVLDSAVVRDATRETRPVRGADESE